MIQKHERPLGYPVRKTYYQRKTKARPVPILVPEHQWTKLIHEAMRAGYSKPSIEAATGLSRERINSIVSGRVAMPQWDHGEKLLKLIYQLRQEKEKENGAEETSGNLSQELP